MPLPAPLPGAVALELAGEAVQLLGERALWWPAAATLVAADLHWGKGATFRAAGIPIPGGSTADDLARLDRALDRTGARRLLVLGDLFHAKAGRIDTRTLAQLRAWRAQRADVEIVLVRGNHDRHAGDPPADLRINCTDAPAFVPPWVLRHEPAPDAGGFVLAGHVHPAVSVRGAGGFRDRLPCFVVGRRIAVLPAFGSFTGGAETDPAPGDRLFAVAGDEVVPLGD